MQRRRIVQAAGWLGAAALILAAGGCPANRNGDGPLATQPVRPRRPWPGATGRVNRLIVWLHGTGRDGFAIVVNTVQEDSLGNAKFVLEDGAFRFRLFPANAAGQPIVEKPLGQWVFDEAATRNHWSPGGVGGQATYAFGLLWQGPAPPVGMNLILVSEFTPRGRGSTPAHVLAFMMQPTAG